MPRRALYALLFLLLGGVVALSLCGCSNPFGCSIFNMGACPPGGLSWGSGGAGGAGGGAPAAPGCNACDDGQGGTLQTVGEHCAGDDSNPSSNSYNCCHGLACVGALASSMGTCQGTLQCMPAACHCSDGQGGTLGGTGDSCLDSSMCCAELSCVGASPTLTGVCQGPVQCASHSGPLWVGLTTTKLRQIAIANNINGCASQTGITQSRTIGVTFETWVLKTMGQLPRWTKPIMSQQRMNKTGGLPASVIPEYVDSQTKITLTGLLSVTWTTFPNSLFYEVKAVTGNLTPGTSQWQILGLLDVATSFPTVPSGAHAPPAVIFTTTSNTIISQSVVDQAQALKVAVWQLQVFYDANSANPSNPDLSIQTQTCLTPTLYVGSATPGTVIQFRWLNPGMSSWPKNPLTWPTVPEQASVVVPGDPDPAEVD